MEPGPSNGSVGDGWEAPLNGNLGTNASIQLKCCHTPLLTCCYTACKFERGAVPDFSFQKIESLYNIVALISDKAFTVHLFLSSGILPAWVLCQVSSLHSGDFLPPPSTLEGSTTSSWQARSFLRIDNDYFFFSVFPKFLQLQKVPWM